MLTILTSHPIQYQVPIWRALAASGQVPFETWYLTDHGVRNSNDVEFGQSFKWDVDLLSGYPYRFLDVKSDWSLRSFFGVQLRENICERMRNTNMCALWVEGWRFSAFWKGVSAAKRTGAKVWMRGDSNDLKQNLWWKSLPKRTILRRHLNRVDRFLCVGSANRRLYRAYGIPQSRMFAAPHCVDNDRFLQIADNLRSKREEIRATWGVPSAAFCFLFCGKFIPKKRPLDLVRAAEQLSRNVLSERPVHLLFVGTGQLGPQLRRSCRVMFDAELAEGTGNGRETGPKASFAGFVNQADIPAAYVAADALVLPSDSGETWGLVVNEAMACGLPAIVSDLCGCAEDLPARVDKRLVYRCGDVDDLAHAMQFAIESHILPDRIQVAIDQHHLRHTVSKVEELYRELN
jgi:glycosyltransferase involved in cell wall biosynthesis